MCGRREREMCVCGKKGIYICKTGGKKTSFSKRFIFLPYFLTLNSFHLAYGHNTFALLQTLLFTFFHFLFLCNRVCGRNFFLPLAFFSISFSLIRAHFFRHFIRFAFCCTYFLTSFFLRFDQRARLFGMTVYVCERE